MTSDLDELVVLAAVGERAVRSYPALLSTEAAMMAWARQGAATGAAVVADYQASPRGRGGLPWTVRAGSGLGFSLLLRPDLPAEREGWPYVSALQALQDVLGGHLTWPDAVCGEDGTVRARLGVHVELGPAGARWAIVTVLVQDAAPPRALLLARLLEAVEGRSSQPAEQVLTDYLPRCTTLGRQRRARLVPLGPGGPEVTGEAVDVLADGALVLLTARGSRVAVPPHDLGLLEGPAGPVEPPQHLLGS